jgi:hypothetical protein
VSEYVLEVRNASGVVVFDSMDAQGGVCFGAYEVAPGNSITVNLTSYAGRSVRVINHSTTVSVSYAAGYPSVTITTPPSFLVAGYAVILVY